MRRDILFAQIKRNCDISDARYWGFYSICGLLMRLRELFLAEHGLQPWDSVAHEDLSRWISDREALWESLESETPEKLPLNGSLINPFSADEVNAHISSGGLYYGSGIGILGKPVFFLGDSLACFKTEGYKVTVVDREYCRDLSLFPAMLQGKSICIRQDAIKAFLWERIQSFMARPHRLPQDEVFTRYGISHGKPLPEAFSGVVRRIMDDTRDLFVLHEVGEACEGDEYAEWKDFLCSVRDKGCDLYLRGVKDILADTSDRGPLRRIIEDRNELLLSFYLIFLDGIRKELFPVFLDAYRHYRETGDWSVMEQTRQSAHEAAHRLRIDLLQHYREVASPKEIVTHIRTTLGKR